MNISVVGRATDQSGTSSGHNIDTRHQYEATTVIMLKTQVPYTFILYSVMVDRMATTTFEKIFYGDDNISTGRKIILTLNQCLLDILNCYHIIKSAKKPQCQLQVAQHIKIHTFKIQILLKKDHKITNTITKLINLGYIIKYVDNLIIE